MVHFELDNHYLLLDSDPSEENIPRQVYKAYYSFVKPVYFKNAKVLLTSASSGELLGLSKADLQSEELHNLLTAQSDLGSKTYASCYGGHQFGHWAGQLGDGRAISLGQLKGVDDTYTLQLKGVGPTPYSRNGDGFAVLRSSIREYLMSEAMAHLGVPTTRALSLALSGELVKRDRLYNGNPQLEQGAIVCRISKHFIRFGSFELFTAREDIPSLKKLVDYTIEHYYPEITIDSKKDYIKFFEAVVQKSLSTLVWWQSLGFVHGVLNTDNMSITGETIDYGPYGFLDELDPTWTPNTTDAQHRRYRYENQPNIVLWNLFKLANALYPLVEEAQGFEAVLNRFKLQYELQLLEKNKQKLGLYTEEGSDDQLIETMLSLMVQSKADYTLFFRRLSELKSTALKLDSIKDLFYVDELSDELQSNWSAWLNNYKERLDRQGLDEEARQEQMKRQNPRFILRNYMLEEAIVKAEAGDYSLLKEFSELIQTPYADVDRDPWAVKKPKSAGDSALSCSS